MAPSSKAFNWSRFTIAYSLALCCKSVLEDDGTMGVVTFKTRTYRHRYELLTFWPRPSFAITGWIPDRTVTDFTWTCAVSIHEFHFIFSSFVNASACNQGRFLFPNSPIYLVLGWLHLIPLKHMFYLNRLVCFFSCYQMRWRWSYRTAGLSSLIWELFNLPSSAATVLRCDGMRRWNSQSNLIWPFESLS